MSQIACFHSQVLEISATTSSYGAILFTLLILKLTEGAAKLTKQQGDALPCFQSFLQYRFHILRKHNLSPSFAVMSTWQHRHNFPTRETGKTGFSETSFSFRFSIFCQTAQFRYGAGLT
jgi:hypothetical protein